MSFGRNPHVEGDIPDLFSAFDATSEVTMETLTGATIVRISHADLRQAMCAFPVLTEAFTRYLAGDACATAEWLVNVGNRDARAAIAHIFCEVVVRLKQVSGDSFSFGFPVSQIQLGEMCGFSTVHIYRSLMWLRHAGLMLTERGLVHVADWQAPQALAGFDMGYLTSGRKARFVQAPA